MRYRIVNTSTNKSPGGQFLDLGADYKGILIPAGRAVIVEMASLPEFVHGWQEQGLCRVMNADTGADMSTASSAPQFTPGQLRPFGEMPGIDPKGEEDFDEEDFDLSSAVDATLPSAPGAAMGLARPGRPPGPGQAVGAHMPERPGMASHPQYDRANVSAGELKNETRRAGESNELSPIPGETARSLDDSGAFTIRAPRHTGPGAVVSSKR